MKLSILLTRIMHIQMFFFRYGVARKVLLFYVTDFHSSTFEVFCNSLTFFINANQTIKLLIRNKIDSNNILNISYYC